MLSAKQLCAHLCYMLHTPVRLYDAAGNCLTDDVITVDQEDPLVCDPEFAAELLAKLGMIERLAYGMGDFGGNLIYTAISSFLLVYYVSVVGIPSAAAGSILAISKVFDGISDLIMGRIVDKSNSKRGKALPWLIRMSIPMGICSVLMFTIPAGFGPTAKIIYAFYRAVGRIDGRANHGSPRHSGRSHDRSVPCAPAGGLPRGESPLFPRQIRKALRYLR